VSTPAGRPDIGIIGGTGFYSFLSDPQRFTVETPFGPPTADVTVGEVSGRQVAFLPRHGERHQFPPHRVNYRANLWALRSLGVRQVLAPCAVGSLRPELGPGTFVLPDQVVDRTWGRGHTVYDHEGPVVHVGFADPYCPRGRAAVLEASSGQSSQGSSHREDVVSTGTLVVINGPRFSTRAESQWHADQGWSLVGMTGQPEAGIARELALCYTSIAMVTDHDAGIEGVAAVTHAEVLEIFAHNLERLRGLLAATVAGLPLPEDDDESPCPCRRALDGLDLPFALPG
jgi:5'-methylthioadenosine phosphorylase